jgi:hypothetical protein
MKKYIGPIILIVLLLAMIVFPDIIDERMALNERASDHRCVGLVLLLGIPVIVTCAIIVVVQVIRHLIIVIKNFL